MRRASLAVILTVTPIGVLPLTGTPPASITASPPSVVAGEPIVTKGQDFGEGLVRVYIDVVSTSPGLAEAKVGADGTFEVVIDTTAIIPGGHVVIACRDQRRDSTCVQSATTPIRVSTPRTTTTTTTITTPTTTTTTPTATTITTAPSSPTTQPIGVAAATTTTAPSGLPIAQATVPTTTSPQMVLPTVTQGPDSVSTTIPSDLIAVTTTTERPLSFGDPKALPDLRVRAIEITQGIQDLASRMPVVADRRTWVRVHVATDSDEPWGSVDGALRVTGDGFDLVLLPENGPIVTGGDRADLDSALNFLLPQEALGDGSVEYTALVWSGWPETLESQEPNPDNNLMTVRKSFHTALRPTIWLIALDDGGGPGPDVTDMNVLIGYALAANAGLMDLHPIAAVNFEGYPLPLLPGPEAVEPGVWNLDAGDADDGGLKDGFARRSEPNVRMASLAEQLGLLETGNVMGFFDASIEGPYSGWATSGVSWNQPSWGVAPHELGHTRGLSHVGCLDNNGDGEPDEVAGGAVDPKHPTGLPGPCSLAPINPDGYFGITPNQVDPQIYSNDPTHPAAAYPFMSYKSPAWSDPYYNCKLLRAYGVDCRGDQIGVRSRQGPVDCTPEPASYGEIGLQLCLQTDLPEVPSDLDEPSQYAAIVPLSAPKWLLISGLVAAAIDDGQFGRAAVVDSVSPVQRDRFVALAEGFRSTSAVGRIQLVGADGSVLLDVPVDAETAGHGDGAVGGSSSGFMQAVPYPDGVTGIRLLIGGSVVDTKLPSAQPPTISTVEAKHIDGSGDVGSGDVLVSWSASDADADQLLATVSWSADGLRWVPVVIDAAVSEVRIPAAVRLAGGDEVRVRVTVGDGLHIATADSTPFVAPNKVPQLFISGDETGLLEALSVEQFDEVFLQAHVLDPEQGAGLSEQVTWSSSIDGVLPGGNLLRTRDLSLGTHQLVATVADADGAHAESTVTIEVLPRTSPTRYTERPVALVLTRLGLPPDVGRVQADTPLPADVIADRPAATKTAGAVSTGDSSSTRPYVWVVAAGATATGLTAAAVRRRRRRRHVGRPNTS